MNFGSFIEDVRTFVVDIYRDRYFPIVVLVTGVLAGAVLSQWIVIILGVAGFMYYQFVKKDR